LLAVPSALQAILKAVAARGLIKECAIDAGSKSALSDPIDRADLLAAVGLATARALYAVSLV
jgi:hypothetical protein